MPSNYDFKCTNCGFTENRYRNVKRCRKCGSITTRIEPQNGKDAEILRLSTLLKEVKEDGERLAKRWVEYHNDETISCQYCGLTQSGFKNKHTPGCPITKHTALMSELEKREG